MRKQCCDPCWALAHQGQEDTIQRIVSVEGVPSVGRRDIRANPVCRAGWLAWNWGNQYWRELMVCNAHS